MNRILLLIVLCLSLSWGCSGEPESPEELRKAGLKAFNNQEYLQARDYLIEAGKKLTSDKEVLYFTGLAYKRDFLYDSALFYFRRADIHHPFDIEINQQILEVALAGNHWEYAKNAIRAMTEAGQPKEPYYGTLFTIWSQLDNPGNTFYYLRMHYHANGLENMSLFSELIKLSVRWDSVELAQTVLDSAIVLFGENDELTLGQARILIQEGESKTAENILRPIVETNPDNVEMTLNLVSALISQETRPGLEEALILLQEARTRVPEPEFIDSLINYVELQLE
jgi:tetratricopeptide (TPR) repeat protein